MGSGFGSRQNESVGMKTHTRDGIRCKHFLLTVHCVLLTGYVFAAKVIMKDGKIYEGKIITEMNGDILMRTQPGNRPRMLPGSEILSVVRDPVVETPRDPHRYAAIEARISGNVSDSKNVSLNPTPGLSFAGSLRFHPLFEVSGGLDWFPALKGEVAVTDGTTQRGYEYFYAWSGGLSGRLFPFYARGWKIEPFLTSGYHWTRLVPKGSGDSLQGQGLEGGAGAQWPCGKRLYAIAQLVYRRVSLDGISFNGQQGGLISPVFMGDFSFSIGASYRL
jgi:hypothetical protein